MRQAQQDWLAQMVQLAQQARLAQMVQLARQARLAGLKPWFLDIDPTDWQLKPEHVLTALDSAPGPVAAVVAVAPFGAAIDGDTWDAFAAETGLAVAIDAAAGFDSARLANVPADWISRRGPPIELRTILDAPQRNPLSDQRHQTLRFREICTPQAHGDHPRLAVPHLKNSGGVRQSATFRPFEI